MVKTVLLTQRSRLAFLYGAPIGLLGGLIGLGGAEFRLPVLVGPLGYAARQAVPLNLAISLVTLTVALATRARMLSLTLVAPFFPAIGGLIGGAVLTAFIGATLAGKLSEECFERVMLVLLVAVGMALIVEGFLPEEFPGLLPFTAGSHIGAGIVFGLVIGFVSSLLGVAGGELIIPTFVFAFGADIKTAGTASLLVSVPTVVVGIIRYASRGAYAERQSLIETVAPMSLGSLVGAVAGGVLVGFLPAGTLKAALGVILNVSAFQIFRRWHSQRGTTEAVSSSLAQRDITFATTVSPRDSGLLDILVPAFEHRSGHRVKVVAVGTGQALAMAARGESDVVLTHAPDTEKRYLADGTLIRRRFVMHNTFLLAGPVNDPAKIKGTITAIDALRKIVAAKVLFVSRGDDSGTHILEKTLWEQASIQPAGQWYLEADQGMGQTLRIAGEKHAYVLSDRATFLAFQHTTGLAIFLEGDPAFLNLYHVLEPNPAKLPQVNANGGKAFADFLVSMQVQDMLKTFGVDKCKEVLFHPAANKTEEVIL